MSDVTHVKLRDVASRVVIRNSIGNTNVLTISATHGLVSQEEFFNRRVASADLSQYYLLREGDFAYNKSYSAGWPVGVVRRLERYGAGVVSPLYICFRPDPRRVDSSYLQYYFDSGLLDDSILWIAKEGARNHGLLNVGVEDFFDLSLELPQLPEQRRVVEVIDAVSVQEQAIEASIAKLRSVRQGAQLEFMRRVTAGEVEADWVPVRDVGEVRMGKQLSPDSRAAGGQHPYLRVANVFAGWIDYSDVNVMGFTSGERSVYGLAPGDILLNEGQSLELVGRSAIYRGGVGEYCFQNTLVRFRSGERVIPEYAQLVFEYWLQSGVFAAISKKTTSIAHLGGDRFAALSFPLVSLSEQKESIASLARCDASIGAEMGELAKLRKLKQGLVNDLLSGRVAV